jgi:hypothetical protein
MVAAVRLGRRREGNAFSAFNDVPHHGDWAVDIMKLIIKTAGIADGVAGLITAPERGGDCVAIGAHEGLAVDLMLIIGRAAITGDGSPGSIAISVARAGATG